MRRERTGGSNTDPAHAHPSGDPRRDCCWDGPEARKVFVVVADDAVLRTINAACGDRAAIVRAENGAELWRTLPAKEPAVVLAEVTARPGGLTGPEFWELRRRYPWTTRLLLLRLRSAECQVVGSLIRAGVDEVILTGVEDTVNGVRAALAGADLRHLGNELFDMLPMTLSSPVDQLVRLALTRVSQCFDVSDLAESAELKLRTFERRVCGGRAT